MKSSRSGRRFRRLFRKRHRGSHVASAASVLPVHPSGNPDGLVETMDPQRRWTILSSYARVLEECSSTFEPESQLPFPKEMIRQAIWSELAENPDGHLRSHLEIAYAQLEAFLPAEDYDVMKEFRSASSLARRMSLRGDPGSIVESAKILRCARGDKAVSIQERISLRMRQRLRQIQAIGMPFFPPRLNSVLPAIES